MWSSAQEIYQDYLEWIWSSQAGESIHEQYTKEKTILYWKSVFFAKISYENLYNKDTWRKMYKSDHEVIPVLKVDHDINQRFMKRHLGMKVLMKKNTPIFRKYLNENRLKNHRVCVQRRLSKKLGRIVVKVAQAQEIVIIGLWNNCPLYRVPMVAPLKQCLLKNAISYTQKILKT